MKIYQRIASTLIALQNVRRNNNKEWIDRHTETLNKIMTNAPSGSGIDSGTKLEMALINPEKSFVLYCNFHHMNDVGFYDGWTEHTIIVRPDWHGFNLSISGKDRNQIKDHLYDVYYDWLMQDSE